MPFLGELTSRYVDPTAPRPYADGLISRIDELAKKKSVSMAQISLAWIMAKPGVTAPIVGTTSLENLEDLLGGLEFQLSEEEIKYLEEEYKLLPIAGHH